MLMFSNAAIFPTVYFFYPETAYRSLEEMDLIFQKTTSIFKVVGVAKREPHRYDKRGNILIDYQNTEDHRRRRSSMAYASGVSGRLSTASDGAAGEKTFREQDERV